MNIISVLKPENDIIRFKFRTSGGAKSAAVFTYMHKIVFIRRLFVSFRNNTIDYSFFMRYNL